MHRHALWRVTQLCALDARLTGSPLPCLEVSDGYAVLRPFWTWDLMLAPTRPVAGVEDPLLQDPEAPNYLALAWRARRYLPGGERDDVGLAVNPVMMRSQDQLHIHIGCLLPQVRAALQGATIPSERWEKLPAIVPHIAFWGRRIEASQLSEVAPFREAVEALAGLTTDRAKITVVVASLGEGKLALLASYAGAAHSWWPVNADDLLDAECPSADSPYAPASSAPAAATR